MTSSELLAHLKSNPFVLAPMAGITDRPFRSFMREMGCGIVVTELVSATGLKYSPAKTGRIMEFEPAQRPVGIQLFGENLSHLTDAAAAVEQMGADFVDLNFGCPVPKVVNRGAGSACLKDLGALRDTIRAAKAQISIPLTIKIRTGWDEATRNSHEVVKVAAEEDVTWVAIHGRTRAAQYTGQADWDYIADVAKDSPVPVIGNGDITNAEQARQRLEASGGAGVMIGRGCLKNPRLFLEARALIDAGNEPAPDLAAILRRLSLYLESFYDERLTLIQMRKFAAWFSAGLPGAATFRKTLFQTQGREETLASLYGYFDGVASVNAADTSHEPFLMGGHG